ncbi:MAG TPA: helix-turn-helix domain-containing protein [Polyangiaceae bacterium]|jgi:DNA-binding transcriptional MerR regulator
MQLADHGLTSGEVAKQLGCSRSNVDRLRKTGSLPGRPDRAGQYRYQPAAVAEVARKLRRALHTDAERAAQVYARFLSQGFKPTPEAIARIVVETREHPDTVLALWDKFTRGAPRIDEGSAEVARIAHEYDEQIAAMDRELARRRRAAFIPGDGDDDAPPSSRRS